MTFTVPDNVNYIGVSYSSKSPGALTLQGLLNGKPKLEQGSKVTPWMRSSSETIESDYPSHIGNYTGKIVDGQSTDPVRYNWKKNN